MNDITWEQIVVVIVAFIYFICLAIGDYKEKR
jgi:hypothetical protein